MNSDSHDPDEKVLLALSHTEALVLFELLSRFSNDEKLEIHDSAEARVLWNMCCDLEKVLVEPLQADYSQILESARASVRDSTV